MDQVWIQTQGGIFDRTTSKGDPETVKILDRATVGVHYLCPVKNRVPLWFLRLRTQLHRDKSPYVKTLPSQVRLDRQRAQRYDERLLKTKDFMRDPTRTMPMFKEVLQKTTIASFVDSTTGNHKHEQNQNGC